MPTLANAHLLQSQPWIAHRPAHRARPWKRLQLQALIKGLRQPTATGLLAMPQGPLEVARAHLLAQSWVVEKLYLP